MTATPFDGLEPKWPVIQQAAPTKIYPAKSKPVSQRKNGGWDTAVILPDPQIGYRRYDDGTLDPFHDLAAIEIALQVTAYMESTVGVDTVVNLGDFLDLAPQGRFANEATFHATTQPAIDYGHLFLARQRATAPDAHIVLIEGNHDKRMANFIAMNAGAAYGIKKANMPRSLPVMSLQNLLRLDELNVEYIDAWPTGQYWLNERLRCVHGNKVRSGGSTAAMYVKDNQLTSTIFGHCHRVEMHHNTTSDFNGPVRNVAFSPGCLCRTDGAVPSYYSATHEKDGTPATYFENWQNGLAVITYRADGRFSIEPVTIQSDPTAGTAWCVFRGQTFEVQL